VQHDASTFIAAANRPGLPRLLVEAQHALKLTQQEMGELMGASRRTVWRWQTGQSSPLATHLHVLVRRAYPIDAKLASRLATVGNATLERLGLVAAERTLGPAPGAPASMDEALRTRLLVDAIVCSAAEALDASPRLVRRALHAAFSRARETGLAFDAIERALAPAGARRSRRDAG
jgi:transcriptional regulator with XRE-family HTH domain